MHVEITGLTRVRSPKPNRGGSTIIAYFDCEVAGFRLLGCALVRTPKNGLVAWPPRIDAPGETRRAVSIIDDSIRHAMMIHARETYRALGGTDAEWIGRTIPMGPRDEASAEPDAPIVLPPPIRRSIPVTVRKREEPTE